MIFNASEIIEAAIHIEKNGEVFYREVTGKIKDSDVKEVFLYIANEEARHREIYVDLLSHINTSVTFSVGDYSVEYQGFLSAFADYQIFTKENTSQQVLVKIKSRDQAIEFAIRIELDSMLFYTEMKQFIHNNQWSIVDRIINEERGHYLKLSNLQKEIIT